MQEDHRDHVCLDAEDCFTLVMKVRDSTIHRPAKWWKQHPAGRDQRDGKRIWLHSQILFLEPWVLKKGNWWDFRSLRRSWSKYIRRFFPALQNNSTPLNLKQAHPCFGAKKFSKPLQNIFLKKPINFSTRCSKLLCASLLDCFIYVEESAYNQNAAALQYVGKMNVCRFVLAMSMKKWMFGRTGFVFTAWLQLRWHLRNSVNKELKYNASTRCNNKYGFVTTRFAPASTE